MARHSNFLLDWLIESLGICYVQWQAHDSVPFTLRKDSVLAVLTFGVSTMRNVQQFIIKCINIEVGDNQDISGFIISGRTCGGQSMLSIRPCPANFLS